MIRYHNLAVKLQSRTVSTDVCQWIYSMNTFRFLHRPALLQFLQRIGDKNRLHLRRIILCLPTMDYLHLFTPEKLVRELKLPLRTVERAYLLPALSSMHLQCLTVRIHQVIDVAPRATRSYFFGQLQQPSKEKLASELSPGTTAFYASATAPDICWVMKSVTAILGTVVPDLRFETAQPPYKRLLPSCINGELPRALTWDTLM